MKTTIPLCVPPCRLCGNTDYEFVPHTCDQDTMSFELRCKVCDCDRKEFYDIKLDRLSEME